MQMLGFANVGEISNEQALKGQMRAKRIEEGMQKEMLSLVLNEEIFRMNRYALWSILKPQEGLRWDLS